MVQATTRLRCTWLRHGIMRCCCCPTTGNKAASSSLHVIVCRDGSVYGCGANDSGQLPLGGVPLAQPLPQPQPPAELVSAQQRRRSTSPLSGGGGGSGRVSGNVPGDMRRQAAAVLIPQPLRLPFLQVELERMKDRLHAHCVDLSCDILSSDSPQITLYGHQLRHCLWLETMKFSQAVRMCTGALGAGGASSGSPVRAGDQVPELLPCAGGPSEQFLHHWRRRLKEEQHP